MSDESAFLKAVTAYDKRPNKKTAIEIWEIHFGPDSTRPLRISQLAREDLRETIEHYGNVKAARDAKYGGANPFKRIKRAMTADGAKAEAGVFAEAAKEVERNQRLTGTQIAILEITRMKTNYGAEKARKIAEARLSDQNFKGDAQALATAMKRADLTINFKADAFFSSVGAVNSNGFLNMWTRGANPGDNVDTRERNKAELNAFEQFRYQSSFSGESRPFYAAVNVGRRVQGGASGYGNSHFVLKEAVKERSTFTPSDTFYLSRYVVSDAGLRKLRGKIDPLLHAAVTADKGKVIDDREQGGPAFNGWMRDVVKNSKMAKRGGESTDAFEDRKRMETQEVREALRVAGMEEKVVTSYERMDRIVAFLQDQMLKQISTYAVNPDAKNLQLPAYVEAQVHGPIEWSRDIERIVIADWELDGNDEAKVNLESFSKKHGIPYSFITADDLG